MNLRALIDANVFVTIIVFDLLMRHAEHGHFDPIWSHKITDEVYEALTTRLKKPWPETKVERLLTSANTSFASALIEEETAIVEMTDIDEGDRHIVSTALSGRANVIITYNLRDFPVAALARFDIRPLHPDEFLSELRESHGETQTFFAREMARVRNLSYELFLTRLVKSCPRTAKALLDS